MVGSPYCFVAAIPPHHDISPMRNGDCLALTVARKVIPRFVTGSGKQLRQAKQIQPRPTSNQPARQIEREVPTTKFQSAARQR